MESKESRMSQRSSVVGGAMAGSAVQAKLVKNLSKASLTPSQMSERTRLNAANANKDPIDALSRGVPQRMMNFEKRSGLQDVDDNYLKNVVYAFSTQKGLETAQRKVTAEMMPAGVPTKREIQSKIGTIGGNRAAAGGVNEMPVIQEQVPGQQPGGEPAQGNVAQEQYQAVQQQQQQQQPPQQVQNPNQGQKPASAVPPQQGSGGGGAAAAPVNAGGNQQGSGEPELYTTCPNCRATLYLLRSGNEAAAYGTQPDAGAASQGITQQ